MPVESGCGLVRSRTSTIRKRTEEVLRRAEKLRGPPRKVMAAALAHEINNPLASVTNALYLALQDEALRPDTRQYLKLADQELARVARVTSNSLRFHKQSSAAMPVDLAEVRNSVLATSAPRLQGGNEHYGRPRLPHARAALLPHRRYAPGVRTPRQQLAGCHGSRGSVAGSHPLVPVQVEVRRGKHQGRRRRHRPWHSRSLASPRSRSVYDDQRASWHRPGPLWVAEDIVSRHNGNIAIRSRTTGPTRGTVVALFFPFVGIVPTYCACQANSCRRLKPPQTLWPR